MSIFALAFCLLFSSTRYVRAVNVAFDTGSLIIPMDTDSNGQNYGMLTAYGLVYELLRNDVPVYWIINSAKGANGNDFTIATSNSLQDVRTGATLAPRSYRGGPFVIAATDAAAALPIIQTWQAVAGDQTAVHRYLSSSALNVDVSRELLRAPRIAIIKDGNETIAFNDFNAARVPDSLGNAWSASSPDLLTEADLAGPTSSDHKDGVLFANSTTTRFCFLAAMHYNTTSTTEEVVAELRSWLASSSLLHAYAQCAAISTFENATAGLFLTNAGISDDGVATSNPVIRVPANPLTQMDGTFQTDSGVVDSFKANASGGSDYKTGVTTLINDSASPLVQRITMMTGRLDGVSTNAQVTYLGGHDYAVDLPITTNPQTNGVRLLLDALFKSDCASAASQPDVTLTKTAPALTNASLIPYTITVTNPAGATAPAENLEVTDTLPAGMTYVNASGSPAPTSVSGGILTWDLPPLAPGASATITFQTSVTVDGTYTNNAEVDFASTVTRTVDAAPAVTVRDTVPPTVLIPVPPNATTFTTSTPTFSFLVGGDADSSSCSVDSSSFVPCTSPFTSSALTNGPHTFNVRASDAAGNTATANLNFEINPPAEEEQFVSLTVTPHPVGKGGVARFTAYIAEPLSQDLMIHYTMSGNAVYGTDYKLSGKHGKILIRAGHTTGTVDLRNISDGHKKQMRATMTLTDGSGYDPDPEHSVAAVIIKRVH